MPKPRVLVLRAPGTNCDQETAFAFEQAGGLAEAIHVNRLLENPQLPLDFQILCLPGGFSYGDDLAAGRILANQLRHHLDQTLHEFKTADRLILGICNGFQVLIKSGVLLAGDDGGAAATLTWNDSGRYEDRWSHLRVDGDGCVFLRGIDRIELPVAHAEGKFVARSAAVLAELDARARLVLRYQGREVEGQVVYPDNPNGSQANVAGACDETGRVFGLMPHPERNIAPTHHPQWTRRSSAECGHGLRIFQNAIDYFR
jgi:phosphoribosylformylglycinamidine synthase subunit PurQ / glutaminase